MYIQVLGLKISENNVNNCLLNESSCMIGFAAVSYTIEQVIMNTSAMKLKVFIS